MKITDQTSFVLSILTLEEKHELAGRVFSGRGYGKEHPMDPVLSELIKIYDRTLTKDNTTERLLNCKLVILRIVYGTD